MRKIVIVLAGAAALAACLSPMQATAGWLSWLFDAAEESGVVSIERGALRSLEEAPLNTVKPLEKVPKEPAAKAENAHASGAAENTAETTSSWDAELAKVTKEAAKEAAREAPKEAAEAAKNEGEIGPEGWLVLISIFVLCAGLVFVVLRVSTS